MHFKPRFSICGNENVVQVNRPPEKIQSFTGFCASVR
jgi:hypothetical protein